MNAYFITNFDVKGLWGYKNYSIRLHEDVNVIIGPNASGKTTLINILYDTLTANFPRLCRTQFSEVVLGLKAFEGNERREIRLTQSEQDLKIQIDKDSFPVSLTPFQQFGDDPSFADIPLEMVRRHFGIHGDLRRLQTSLRELVPAVWLPVSRRLPIAEEEEMARKRLHRKPLESVDECLAGLVDSLQQYRLSLNTELSELRKEFQRHALENILYDKQHDRLLLKPQPSIAPSEEDKQALLQAFRDVGLVDRNMEARINDHFAAAKSALSKFTSSPTKIDMETLIIIPLISRTRSIVTFAQELETKREKLFSPLHSYERIVNSFLREKSVNVSDRGELVISPNKAQRGPIEWRHLSSGEKQILILLTQALLSEKSPAVYVADEPELSLHVSWQEKLLGSLTQLAGRCQFIVATHSPDIAAGFGNKVIDLARL
ncbi:MAG: ATP-binding protein [Candidatus Competibacteraceae bacterium]|nr:ATP-binding protein [Candidatus Competibacteraceae bacterium]